MEDTSINILRTHRLHITEARIRILALFEKRDDGMTSGQIEKCLGDSTDRATIYRNLQVFLKKGILHCVPTVTPVVMYVMCKAHGRMLRHAHFVCDGCGKSYCLESVGIPSVEIVADFIVTQSDLVIRGRCNWCK